MAIKMPQNQNKKFFLYQFSRGYRSKIEFWIRPESLWDFIEIFWGTKKTKRSHRSFLLFPDFNFLNKRVNLVFSQKTQDFGNILKFFKIPWVGFFLPSFFFFELYLKGFGNLIKSSQDFKPLIIYLWKYITQKVTFQETRSTFNY
mmetsp:Transcript_3575/g.7384  ORF Transcript_3575/g.7384 Transcript_3575/m.7384 type:complete len:145 (+) Transcript_3575:409-843(+)